MNGSPLGQYTPKVAAIATLGLIGAYVLAVMLGLPGASNLQLPASLALGAVFGQAAFLNGWRRPVEDLTRIATEAHRVAEEAKIDAVAAHVRLDSAGTPPAAQP